MKLFRLLTAFLSTMTMASCFFGPSDKGVEELEKSIDELRGILEKIEGDSTEERRIVQSFEKIYSLLDEMGGEADEIREEVESIENTMEELYYPTDDIEDVIRHIENANDEL